MKKAVCSFAKTGAPSWEEVPKLTDETEYISQFVISESDDPIHCPDSAQDIISCWGRTIPQQHELMNVMRPHIKRTIEIKYE